MNLKTVPRLILTSGPRDEPRVAGTLPRRCGIRATTARRLAERATADRSRLAELGRAADSALHIHQALMERPIETAGWLTERTAMAPATVNRALERLAAHGIVRELTARRRNRLFSYAAFSEQLNRGTEPPR